MISNLKNEFTVNKWLRYFVNNFISLDWTRPRITFPFNTFEHLLLHVLFSYEQMEPCGREQMIFNVL